MVKLKDRLLYGDLRNWPSPAQPDAVEDEDSVDGDYGVGKRGDEVVISLGAIPPFQVPKDTAIKLAALLLKQAGCQVAVDQYQSAIGGKLVASWGKLDG